MRMHLRNGSPVTTERDEEVRRIRPPPSPWLPSISTTSLKCLDQFLTSMMPHAGNDDSTSDRVNHEIAATWRALALSSPQLFREKSARRSPVPARRAAGVIHL